MKTYWIVVGKTVALDPHRHSTEFGASQEAKRLARINRGVTFTVFRAVETNTTPEDVYTVRFEEEPPF